MDTLERLARLARVKKIAISVWIAAAAATVLLLLAAILWQGQWLWALGAFIVSTAAKWAARGANRESSRIQYEQAMREHGFSTEEAHKAWEQAYYGGADKLAELRRGEPPRA